ncbi:glycosyltransferase family 4 protein [Propylenella binzhouense]|uniref:Glycosyltransferase family 1 protein n=1 Tax=Propylenella binzhouense TaxID=2555902 RepID=A0A964T8E4_9HYPH|nr:glycosyltransferase family 4 protein [Propylenella binzhouense]MYZ49242.1 glycosyltransferase family 1 protein [Propylenella binzhouense]
MAETRLSILHVVRSPIGGIFRHIADLALAQTRAGHRVGILCDSSTGGAFEAEMIARLAPEIAEGVERIPMTRAIGPRDLPTVLAVARTARRLRPDVIHAHGAKGGVYGRLAGALERRRGRPVCAFYAPHGGSLHYDPKSLEGRVYFKVERALEHLTDGLVHVSRYEQQTYREKVGIPRCPAHVVHNGLRPEEFDPVSPAPDPVDFLYIGMMRDLKGVDLFIEALRATARSNPAVRAVLVGDGEPADMVRYRAMVAEAGLGERVRFEPPMPARGAFALARTIVVPSRAESLPYIVLEAGAAGLPMIATRVGGIPEIFEGEADKLVAPGSAAALAAAMAGALGDPARMADDAARRRGRLSRQFSLAHMVESIEAIYRAALARRIPGSRPGDSGNDPGRPGESARAA